MKLTPMDITNKEFKNSFRGYEKEDVDLFLDRVTEDYEFIYKENATLKERVKAFEDRIEHYEKLESTLQSTLVLAQNAADQSKRSAQKEAELIISSSNDTAKQVIDKANAEVLRINDDFENVKQDFLKFRTKYKNMINTQLEIFEELEKEFLKNYNLGHVTEDVSINVKLNNILKRNAKLEDKQEAKIEAEPVIELEEIEINNNDLTLEEVAVSKVEVSNEEKENNEIISDIDDIKNYFIDEDEEE